MPEQAYIDGTLAVYEFNQIDLLRDVFSWLYERSCSAISPLRFVYPDTIARIGYPRKLVISDYALKTEGTLAVWLFPISGWVPKSIHQSGLFTYVSKRNGVYNCSRC